MKQYLALFLALVMVLSLFAGCGSNQTDTTKPNSAEATGAAEISTDEQGRTVVRVGIQAAPTTMAPWEAMSMGGIATRRSIYEFLVDKVSFGGEMVGVLMESWEKVDDTTYNCTIYKDIYDTEGNHMTAADVVFSYMKAKELGNMAKLSVIVEVTAVDEYTAQFRFEKPLGLGDIETLWSEAPVVTKAAYEASPDNMATTPVGTTAYKIAEYVAGASITLEKTGNYWQKDESKYGTYSAANVDVIKYIVISDTAQLTMALENGSIDISAGITADDIHRFQDAPGYKVSSYPDNMLNLLIPNCSVDNALSNQALREAVYYAINPEEILLGVYGGEGIMAHSNGSSIYGDADPAWENAEYWPQDIELAKQKLEEAGYKEGELTLNLICQNTAQPQAMATMIQAYLSGIGITVKINAYENAMFNTLIKDSAEWDLAINSVGSSDYLINLWKLVLSKDNNTWEGTSNFVFDEELQDLLAEAATLEGHTAENMNAINDLITENAYFYALFNAKSYIAHTDAIDTVALDFRNQVMAHCCTYNTNVKTEDEIPEDIQPITTEPPVEETEPAAPVLLDKAIETPVDASEIAGTYTWSIDPGFGFVATYTGAFNADGTYTLDVTGMPNGDLSFAGTFETDGKRIHCGASTTEDAYDPAWGIYEEDDTCWWIITGEGTWIPLNNYDASAEAPAMDKSLSGTYEWSVDPGFGFVMVMTGTLNEDGTYTLAVTGLPNGDMNLAGTYVSDGENVQLVTNTGDAYDANWGIEEADGSSWWIITGEDEWVPRNKA